MTGPPSITGNLLWVLQLTYTHYQYRFALLIEWLSVISDISISMNDTILTDFLYPILRRAVNFYSHFQFNGTDGYVHLPVTFSPEYPYTGTVPSKPAFIRVISLRRQRH